MATKNSSGPRLSMATKIAVYFALVMLSIPAILPLIHMVSTSFKGNAQIFSGGDFNVKSLIPNPVVTNNYPEAMRNMTVCLASASAMVMFRWASFWARWRAASAWFTSMSI